MRILLALLSLSLGSASAESLLNLMTTLPGAAVMSTEDCARLKGFAPQFKAPGCVRFTGVSPQGVMSASILLALTNHFRFVLATYEEGDALMPEFQRIAWYRSDPDTLAYMMFISGGFLEREVMLVVDESPR